MQVTPEYIDAIKEGILENAISNYQFDLTKDTKASRSYFKQNKYVLQDCPISSEDIEKITKGKPFELSIQFNSKPSSLDLYFEIKYTEEGYKNLETILSDAGYQVKREIAKLLFPNDTSKHYFTVIKCEVMQLFMTGKISWDECVEMHSQNCEL